MLTYPHSVPLDYTEVINATHYSDEDMTKLVLMVVREFNRELTDPVHLGPLAILPYKRTEKAHKVRRNGKEMDPLLGNPAGRGSIRVVAIDEAFPSVLQALGMSVKGIAPLRLMQEIAYEVLRQLWYTAGRLDREMDPFTLTAAKTFLFLPMEQVYRRAVGLDGSERILSRVRVNLEYTALRYDTTKTVPKGVRQRANEVRDAQRRGFYADVVQTHTKKAEGSMRGLLRLACKADGTAREEREKKFEAWWATRPF